MRNIIAILLILASIGVYYGFTNGTFSQIKDLKSQIADVESAISVADQLKTKVDGLTQKANAFNPDDKDKLNKLIPDNADNVRLIVDIQNIASEAGLKIGNIRVNDQKVDSSTTSTDPNAVSGAKYSAVSLSFSVTSSYENFTSFLNKLENSLRIVDITMLTVTSTPTSNTYTYDITLKAYWLK